MTRARFDVLSEFLQLEDFLMQPTANFKKAPGWTWSSCPRRGVPCMPTSTCLPACRPALDNCLGCCMYMYEGLIFLRFSSLERLERSRSSTLRRPGGSIDQLQQLRLHQFRHCFIVAIANKLVCGSPDWLPPGESTEIRYPIRIQPSGKQPININIEFSTKTSKTSPQEYVLQILGAYRAHTPTPRPASQPASQASTRACPPLKFFFSLSL